ncbi:tumor necrosis factor receptor superfamily member 19L [Falco rusticolus]|uniref:tumor necrosis factor receptor superfamily member 19L n=1 Tax=Falco cherrug TaxID=345164 RepID=UPI001886917D|nr:tumor necrosis factor receptor superfamily member 19L [Falco cherrug]XP_037232365.1 tumor necrosis factor receptor superfamily member 19L [Falco rusticolus]
MRSLGKAPTKEEALTNTPGDRPEDAIQPGTCLALRGGASGNSAPAGSFIRSRRARLGSRAAWGQVCAGDEEEQDALVACHRPGASSLAGADRECHFPWSHRVALCLGDALRVDHAGSPGAGTAPLGWPGLSEGHHGLVLAVVLSLPGVGAGSCGPRERGTPGCPSGQEPTGVCGSAQGPAGTCRACPPGTFSPGDVSCSAHTHCRARNRILLAPGTAVTDSRCGACLPGFYSPEGEREPQGRCLPCATTPRSTPGCPGHRRARSPETLDWPARTNGTQMTLMGEGEEEEAVAAQVTMLTIVLVFCTMGLLGILVCNVLKKTGYCTASKDPQPDGTGPSSIYQLEDANEDTIGMLVRLITEKKENAAALEQLLKEHHGQQPMPPGCTPLNKLHLLPQFPPSCWHQHLHTVQGPAPCTRCCQKWPEVLPLLNATKVPKPKGCPREVPILSVGRFQVSQVPEMRSEAGGEPPGR